MRACLSALVMLTGTLSAFAGQVPGAAERPDIAVSEHDRFYTSDQFSNTVSVINPAGNKLLGVIRLGDPTPGNLSPLYRGQLLVTPRIFPISELLCHRARRGGIMTVHMEQYESAPLFKADNATLSFYATKDGKISVKTARSA